LAPSPIPVFPLDKRTRRFDIPTVSENTQHVSRSCAAVKDHSRTFEELLFVYPVISRRSRGLSIGVNLNPDKVCNFDCIYCEVDRRTPPRALTVDPIRLREELIQVIRRVREGDLLRQSRFSDATGLASDVKDIAFSGDGEPTMIPNFAECAGIVAEVRRQEGLQTTKIVLITDAAGLDKADVKRGLEIMDANHGEVWGKLDAGTEAYYHRVNRSHVRFERILKNLLETARVRPIVIQSLFLRVHGEAMPAAELQAYCTQLNEIVRDGGKIKEVHAYTVARPTPEPYATALGAAGLEAIGEAIRRQTGLPVFTFE
jgi:wyosine [tRNA(Phe)-imidazoG37] synthetase (radical SAM superfamily)